MVGSIPTASSNILSIMITDYKWENSGNAKINDFL